VEEVKARLLYIQALEALRCMDEKVVEHPADADLGYILGIGFPAWTGGVASFVDTVGLATFIAQSQRLAAAHGERFAPSALRREREALGKPLHPRMSSMKALEAANEQA
jgi:3-hydroxyacyl-CoA dehydrogenase / enoyl-CoA hydratase / 3-hydroxybutyryl-CoA epimerase